MLFDLKSSGRRASTHRSTSSPLQLRAFPAQQQHSDFSVLLGPGVLSSKGEQHRRQRKLLNPVFSAAHLRNMTHIFYGVARNVRQAMASRLPLDGTSSVLDVNGWMARTTLEILGQAGLGYSFDNFTEDSTDDFGDALKNFLCVTPGRILSVAR